MKIVKKLEDLFGIKNEDHREIIKYDLKAMLDSVNVFDDLTVEDYDPEKEGWFVYFEEGDNLIKDNEAAVLYESSYGILHKWGDMLPGWETVIKIDDLYLIHMVINNEFTMTYYLPDKLVENSLVKLFLEDQLENTMTLKEYIKR